LPRGESASGRPLAKGIDMESVWDELREVLRSRLSESSYQVWIAPLRYKETEGDDIVVECPNHFFANWVQEHYLPLLKENTVRAGRAWGIKLCPEETTKDPCRAQLHLPNFAPNELPRPRFSEKFTFEEFVVGESNRYAHAACWAAANEDSSHSNVIFIQSHAGLGKSHLSQAVGQTFLERRPRARLCYLTANDFTNQMVRAIQDGHIDSFKRRYRENCDVLLLEEVQTLAGRERTQTELAMALDGLFDEGKIVIFTGSQLPRQIPKVSEQLESRLGCGLITSINPPGPATRRKILLRKAKSQGIRLEQDVVDFLAQHLTGDIRRIEGAVVGLVARSSLLRHPVDMDLARQVVDNLVGEPVVITVDTITDTICRHYRVTKEEIRSKSRKRSIAWPRQVAMYLSRRYTESSLEVIGRAFNRDHATVLHSVKRITTQMEQSGKLRDQVEFLRDRLETKRWQS
jgi:chromosomal replication initiator protein